MKDKLKPKLYYHPESDAYFIEYENISDGVNEVYEVDLKDIVSKRYIFNKIKARIEELKLKVISSCINKHKQEIDSKIEELEYILKQIVENK